MGSPPLDREGSPNVYSCSRYFGCSSVVDSRALNADSSRECPTRRSPPGNAQEPMKGCLTRRTSGSHRRLLPLAALSPCGPSARITTEMPMLGCAKRLSETFPMPMAVPFTAGYFPAMRHSVTPFIVKPTINGVTMESSTSRSRPTGHQHLLAYPNNWLCRTSAPAITAAVAIACLRRSEAFPMILATSLLQIPVNTNCFEITTYHL